jgi:hypothetical protein
VKGVTSTLSLGVFWAWLIQHPNCILRAGSRDSVLFDDEDLHWHLTGDGPFGFLVQVVRGKHVTGEIRLNSDQITYVEGGPGEHEGEFVFELIAEDESDRTAAYFFVLSHDYEAEDRPAKSPVH